MTHNPTTQTGAPRLFLTARSFGELRRASVCGGWAIGEPYTVGMGMGMGMGMGTGTVIVFSLSVGTSIMAPRFLGPAVFGTFTLLTRSSNTPPKLCRFNRAAFTIVRLITAHDLRIFSCRSK